MPEESRIPIAHKNTGTGFIKSCYNASAAFLGIGILTLPYGLSQGGWLTLILLSIIASMSFFTTILLKKCLEAEESLTSYQDIGEHAFGKTGKILASLIANIELYLVATSLLVMEGENLHRLFPDYNLELGNLISIGGKQSFIIITSLAILPSVFLTSLTKLSYVSAVGMMAIIVLVISVFFVGLVGRVGFRHGHGNLLSVDGLPKSICLFIACFGGHSVVPTLYTSMKNKHHFTKVMFVSLVLTGTIYMSMATIGYTMYGGSVNSQITLSLPAREASSKVAIYATLMIPITRYALVVIPIASAIENGPLRNYSDKKFIRHLVRTTLLASSTVIACVFPYFESLMALTGSMFVVLVSFLLPCSCYLKISGAHKKLNKEFVCTICILLFGCLAGIVGTNSSVKEFIHKV